jgi:hypothetical protein
VELSTKVASFAKGGELKFVLRRTREDAQHLK